MLIVHLQELVRSVAARGTINVRVDGPYGYASEPEWTLYDTIIMVAGGIGVSFPACHLPAPSLFECASAIFTSSQKDLKALPGTTFIICPELLESCTIKEPYTAFLSHTDTDVLPKTVIFKSTLQFQASRHVWHGISEVFSHPDLQITPLLSMLREIQTQHRRVRVEAKKLDSEQQRPHLPNQVHLIWAVRNRDELQLLDQELLDTAG